MTKKITFISETEAQVTKAFAKKAVIFGTEEYKLWREYRIDYPNASMVTKTIKRNPNKKNYRNMKYDNMRKYIETVAKNDEEKNKALAEFERQHALACIKPSPYHAMVEWFEETYGNVKFPDANENDNESAKTVEAA